MAARPEVVALLTDFEVEGTGSEQRFVHRDGRPFTEAETELVSGATEEDMRAAANELAAAPQRLAELLMPYIQTAAEEVSENPPPTSGSPPATAGSLPPTADYFDGWYADMAASPVKDEIQQRHLGLPPRLLSTSLLGWEGIAEVTAELRLAPGDTLVDLACGRGGYGLEIAGRTGARLIGIDFSAEAVRQARENAERLGATAEFRVGDLTATGLDAGSAAAVLCVDAIQFAAPPQAAYREIRRILEPGGRAVLTCWETDDRDDERVPARLRQVDLRAGLTAAGFADVEVHDRPGWRAGERAMWEEAAALDPGDDPALRSFHDEGVRSLRMLDLVRRVLATATAP
jgi:SAM-dependent methyltransferase